MNNPPTAVGGIPAIGSGAGWGLEQSIRVWIGYVVLPLVR
jgi:hypothetical protein